MANNRLEWRDLESRQTQIKFYERISWEKNTQLQKSLEKTEYCVVASMPDSVLRIQEQLNFSNNTVLRKKKKINTDKKCFSVILRARRNVVRVLVCQRTIPQFPVIWAAQALAISIARNSKIMRGLFIKWHRAQSHGLAYLLNAFTTLHSFGLQVDNYSRNDHRYEREKFSDTKMLATKRWLLCDFSGITCPSIANRFRAAHEKANFSR